MFQQKWLHYVLRFFGLCICVCVIGLLIFFKSQTFTQIGLTRGSESEFQFLPFIVQLIGTPSPPPTNTPTPTVTITSTPTPSITPTPTSSPTPTVTPSPTSTSTPTSTPIFTCPTPHYNFVYAEAENFLCGGEGVAYHDNDPINQGGQYRPNEGVDIAVAFDPQYGNSYYVGWTESGEWLTYSFIVSYLSYPTDFHFRVSSSLSTSRFHVEIDGINVTGSILMPDTGDIQSWETITFGSTVYLLLEPGIHTVRLVVEEGGGNYNHLDIGFATPNPFLADRSQD